MLPWPVAPLHAGASGGLEGYSLQVFEKFLERGVDVRLFVAETSIEDTRVITLPHLRHFGLVDPVYVWECLRAISDDTKLYAINQPIAALLSPCWCRLGSILEFPLASDPDARKHYLKSRYVCVSEFVKRRLLGSCPWLPEQTVRVIRNGVNTSLFHPMERFRNPRPRIVFAGQWNEAKGIYDFLAAAQILERRNVPVQVVLCGSVNLWGMAYASDQQKKLNQTRKDEEKKILSIAERLSDVRIMGALPRDRLAEVYRQSDVLVFPSRWQEPFGNAILEAMASGLPVVATRVGGVPEIVEDKETGLLVPAGQPEAMAGAIESMLSDKGLTQRLADAGLRRVRSSFTWERHMDELTAFLSEEL